MMSLLFKRCCSRIQLLEYPPPALIGGFNLKMNAQVGSWIIPLFDCEQKNRCNPGVDPGILVTQNHRRYLFGSKRYFLSYLPSPHPIA